MTDDAGRTTTAAGLPPRARQVLGALAARYDRLLSKDSLADAIWGDRLPDKYGAALEHYISVLRRRLEPGQPRAESFIVTRAGGYLFTTERASLDLAEVHRLVAQADLCPVGAPRRVDLRRRVIECAPTLPFAEDEYATWATGPRAELRDLLLAAHVEVGSAVEAADPEEALRMARRAIDLDRYAERPYQIAMRAAAALGRPDEALRWYSQCSQRMWEELGVGPSGTTSQLRDRIATERATPGPALTVVSGSGGVRAGRPRRDARQAPDAVLGRFPTPPDDFIGRRDELELILGTAPVPLLHLVGPPGAGKSALLTELRRRAPERVAVGAAAGAGELRLSWLHSVVTQLRIDGAAARAVDQAAATGRSMTREELAELVDALDDRGPVVLGIDDAAVLDRQSVAELDWIGRHGRVGLALALRCEADLEELPVDRLHGPVVLHLRRLTDAELRSGGHPDGADRSGGIPALLTALRQPRRAALATAVHLVGLRIRGLPAVAGQLLRACATLGSLSVEQLAALTETPLAEVLACTDQLVHAELIDEGPGGRIRHSSELVRVALAAQVSSAHTGYLRQRLKAASA